MNDEDKKTLDEDGLLHSTNDQPSLQGPMLSRGPGGATAAHQQRQWHRHGKLHRETGPALVLHSQGMILAVSYCLEGTIVPYSDWQEITGSVEPEVVAGAVRTRHIKSGYNKPS